MGTTLFVAGFGSRIRARDLAYEFERYGRLVRCDIPAPKSYSSKPYAFVEFEDPRDAEDSFNEMHGRRIDGYTISVQWARNAPSSSWRFERPTRRGGRSPSPPLGPPRHPSYGRSRSRSPYGGGAGRSPPPMSHGSGSGGYPPHHPPPHLHHHHHHHHGRPPSPLRGRSPPPLMHGRDRYDRSRSPPPPPSSGRPSGEYPHPSTAPTARRSSFERRPSRSPSPPPPPMHHYRGGPPSRSSSPPPQRRSVSPRRSRSPDQQ